MGDIYTIDNLPSEFMEIKKVMTEVAGTQFKVTNTQLCKDIAYGIITRKYNDELIVDYDKKLDYIISLIKSSFTYRSVLIPSLPQYLLLKEDMENPFIFNKLINDLNKDFLERIDDIPRGRFSKDDILNIISGKYGFIQYLTKEDAKLVDVDKMYYLVLFIYDYVQFSFNEMKVNQHIKLGLKRTSVEVDGNKYLSNALIDEMLLEYIKMPFDIVQNDGIKVLVPRNNELYVPNDIAEETHPCSNINNHVAMFYDLFQKFLINLNLTKRKGATLSSLESDFIAQLAKVCGICNTDKATSVAAMYKQHKNYFMDCQLYYYIRENQYGRLIINDFEEHIFNPLHN